MSEYYDYEEPRLEIVESYEEVKEYENVIVENTYNEYFLTEREI